MAGNVDTTLDSAIMAERTCMYSLLLKACSKVCCNFDSKCWMTILKRSNEMCDGGFSVSALPPLEPLPFAPSKASTRNPRLPLASSVKT